MTDTVVGALLVGVLVDRSSIVGTVVAEGNGGFVGARVGRNDSTSSFVGIWEGRNDNTSFPNDAGVGMGVGCFVGIEEGAFDCVGLVEGD